MSDKTAVTALKRWNIIAHPFTKGKRVKVTAVHVDESHATTRVEFVPLGRDGEVISGGGSTTFRTWDTVTVFPSDGAGSTSGVNNAANGPQKGSNMATVTRKGGAKSTAKTAAKPKTTAAKPAAAKPAKAASTRRTAEDVRKLVPQFVKHLQAGGKMRELKVTHGFSDDGPIRSALYFEGYDSKGNPHGETEGDIDATKAAGKKQLVTLREGGAGWYVLAYRSGLTEPEVKKIVADAGGPTGRVYREPAPKPAAAKSNGAGKAATAKKTTVKKGAKADPSPQA